LDACTVDEDMDLAVHDIKRGLEDTFDGFHIRQIAKDNFDASARARLAEDVYGGYVSVCLRSDNEAERCASLGESNRTCPAYPCIVSDHDVRKIKQKKVPRVAPVMRTF